MTPPKRYSFVNARPQTKAERRQTRTAIRSHIGKWTQEQQQKLDVLESTSSSSDVKSSATEDTQVYSLSPPSPERCRAKGRPEDADASTLRGASSTSVKTEDDCIVDRDRQTNQARVFADPDWQLVVVAASSKSVQIFGSGVLDPFGTYPSTFDPALISQCWEYSIAVVWPGLMPPGNAKSDSFGRRGWFPMVQEDPVALHSLLYGALSHRRLSLLKTPGKQSDPSLDQLELWMQMCEAESIVLINNVIKRGVIHDKVIVSVLCLASNSWDVTLEEYQKRPPPPPFFDPLLKSLQFLDVYGLLSVHWAHAIGLIAIINMRGGLKQIKTPGLAATISYSGIINSSRYQRRPAFPFIPLVEQNVEVTTLRDVLGPTPQELEDRSVFGDMFEQGPMLELALVIVAMHRYEQKVEYLVDGLLTEFDFPRLCDTRNLIQHGLLSLLPDETDPTSVAGGPIFQSLRVAVMIYSLTVIFPLPTQTAPVPELSKQLFASIRNSELQRDWLFSRQSHRLLLWILVVGGVASRDLPDQRAWYTRVLHKLTKNTFRDFDILKEKVLTPVLWLGRSCDAAGKVLWAEINARNDADA